MRAVGGQKKGGKINICVAEGDRRFDGITFCLYLVKLAVIQITGLSYCNPELRDDLHSSSSGGDWIEENPLLVALGCSLPPSQALLLSLAQVLLQKLHFWAVRIK